MKRDFPRLLVLAALMGSSSTIYAQYPYPYAPPAYAPIPMQPMPMQPMQPMQPIPMSMQQMRPIPMQGYSYPSAMTMRPGYYPANYMMARPGYYYPASTQMPTPYGPMYSSTISPAPKVLNYGPLLSENSIPITSSNSSSNPNLATSTIPVSGVIKTNAVRAEVVMDACGPQGCPPIACASGGCAGACDDGCDSCKRAEPPIPLPRPHPHGHFIGIVGTSFLVPYPDTRTAFSTTTAAGTTTTNFSHELAYAPFGSLAYIFHNGWGVRGDIFYLHSRTTTSTTNADTTLGTTITTPGAPGFQIISPSATLRAGIGADQFSFARTFDFRVTDLEVVKECNVFDMCFLFGAGARYASLTQSYSATRTNSGGMNNAGDVVTVDRENVGLRSRFEGEGPTTSFEFIHPVRGTCFSMYGNLRGSFLYGIEQFHSERTLTSTPPAVVATPVTSTIIANDTRDHRVVSMGEIETGIQLSKTYGRYYFFGRAGGVYQRWWDVGNPLGASGNLYLVGGTLKLGVSY